MKKHHRRLICASAAAGLLALTMSSTKATPLSAMTGLEQTSPAAETNSFTFVARRFYPRHRSGGYHGNWNGSHHGGWHGGYHGGYYGHHHHNNNNNYFWPGYGAGLLWGLGSGLYFGGYGAPYYGGGYYGGGYYGDGYYGAAGSHEAWCYRRYRSYDARTDTFMGYDGRRHYCRGPY